MSHGGKEKKEGVSLQWKLSVDFRDYFWPSSKNIVISPSQMYSLKDEAAVCRLPAPASLNSQGRRMLTRTMIHISHRRIKSASPTKSSVC